MYSDFLFFIKTKSVDRLINDCMPIFDALIRTIALSVQQSVLLKTYDITD